MIELVSIVIAVVALAVSVSIERFSIRQDREHHLDSVWRQIMSGVDRQPQFSDISKTENYLKVFDWRERLRYDSFCIQAWTACYQLVRSSRRLPLDQRLAVEWMVAYHRQWLHGNARLFPDEKFWRLIDDLDRDDPRITIHRPVPSKEGLATWDDLLGRYFDTFLSPFDPSIPPGRRLEERLAEVLQERNVGEGDLIADLGCGIGTAFPVLAPHTRRYHGLDLNMQPLVASRQSSRWRPPLVNADIRTLPYPDDTFEVIIAINVVLLESRADNQQALAEISRVLKPDGLTILLLPAFETITHLRQLRVAEAHATAGPAYARRVEQAFDHLRDPHPETSSYVGRRRHPPVLPQPRYHRCGVEQRRPCHPRWARGVLLSMGPNP